MMKNRVAVVCLLFVLFVVWNTASGETQQDLVPDHDAVETEKMVVTSTMTEKIIKDAPGCVEVISEQEILDMNAETVADALREATSLLVTTESGRIKRPSIRGTGSQHTLVLLDGRRITSGFKDMAGLEQIPVDLIKRIEVVRGPASALYGSDAIGGVVNIITKKPSKKLTAGATAQYGQNDHGEGQEYLGRAYIGNTFKRFGYFLTGGYLNRDGYDLDGEAPDDADSIEMKSAGGRFSYDLSDDHSLLAGFEAVDRNFVGLRNLQNQDRERDMDDRRLNYFLEYDGKINPYSSLMLRANRSEHENELVVTPPTSAIAGSIGDESNAQRDLNQLEGRFSTLLFKKHLVTVGSEYVREGRKDDSGLDDNFETYSIYAQDEYQILAPLYLVMSVRWDDYSNFGSQWTPRASLTYSILDNLRLKGSYGRGFRAPDFLELYLPTYMKQGKQVYEPNADLEAESSESYEIGIEGEYKRFQGRLTWFKTNIEDLIEAVYYTSTGSGKSKIDYYQYQNIAEASMQGVEFEFTLKLIAGFDLSGNLTYLETEDKTTGQEMEGRPDYKGSLKLGYHHLPLGIRANVRLNYIGERYYEAGGYNGYTTVNTYVSKEINRWLTLFGGVDNLFTSEDDDSADPLFFYGGVRLSYN